MNEYCITSPCHPTYPLVVEMETTGRPYMTYETPAGFYCDAPSCSNAWDINGAPREY